MVRCQDGSGKIAELLIEIKDDNPLPEQIPVSLITTINGQRYTGEATLTRS
jgi:hypothetical protein